MRIEPTLTAVTMSNTINTNTTLFDNMEIKVLDTYQISLSMTGYSVIPYEQEMGYKLKYNGAVIYEESFDVAPSTAGFTIIPTEFKKAINLTVTPAMVGVYTIEMWNVDEISNGIGITDLSFSITKQDVLEKPVRTYAQLVDKMLRNTDYVLSPKSRIRLNITAPEGKWEGYTVYDALQKIGGELRALVRVGDEVLKRAWYVTASSLTYIDGESITEFNPYEYDVDTILKIGSKYYINRETDVYVRYVDFEFFDNPSVFEPIGEIYRSEQAELEDYVSSLELNTSNVVKPLRYSPFKNGWMGLRNIDGIGQMTTANIGYQTEDDIERVISVKVKGLESKMGR